MTLPTLQPKMSPSPMEHGTEGKALQRMRNREFEISCVATRERKGAGWRYEWTADALPGKSFPNYIALRNAVNADPAQK